MIKNLHNLHPETGTIDKFFNGKQHSGEYNDKNSNDGKCQHVVIILNIIISHSKSFQ